MKPLDSTDSKHLRERMVAAGASAAEKFLTELGPGTKELSWFNVKNAERVRAERMVRGMDKNVMSRDSLTRASKE